jgi:hypothetical protein
MKSGYQVSQFFLWVDISFPLQGGLELYNTSWAPSFAIYDIIFYLADRVLGQIEIRAYYRVVHTPYTIPCGHLG